MLHNSGRIELILGPMFAGKTTELMRRVKREIHARRRCFVIKYSKDVRYDEENVASHDHATLRAQAAVATLSEVKEAWREFDVVAVDEGQFFPDIVPFCNTAADAGKVVMVSALDGDYLRRPFGQICELFPHCESVEKLTAVCMMCHCQLASFTRRTVEASEQELIGGADMYIATCRNCHNAKSIPSITAMRNVNKAIKEVEEACLGVTRYRGISDAANDVPKSPTVGADRSLPTSPAAKLTRSETELSTSDSSSMVQAEGLLKS